MHHTAPVAPISATLPPTPAIPTPPTAAGLSTLPTSCQPSSPVPGASHCVSPPPANSAASMPTPPARLAYSSAFSFASPCASFLVLSLAVDRWPSLPGFPALRLWLSALPGPKSRLCGLPHPSPDTIFPILWYTALASLSWLFLGWVQCTRFPQGWHFPLYVPSSPILGLITNFLPLFPTYFCPLRDTLTLAPVGIEGHCTWP
jgi:hypothetical protein